MAKDQGGDSGPSQILRLEGFTLDLDGHALADATGRDVPLTPAEFGLLAAFVRGAGRALSRDHLLQAVAGRDTEAFDRSVDVLVGRLRRKIEADPKAPRLIVTVPGVGYKFTIRSVAAATSPGPGTPAVEPDRPSLAVLPFANLSGDPEQDYFADGIVEELTNALSRVRWFFVIARNSSFTYKGRAVDIRQVGRELGVRYVLEAASARPGTACASPRSSSKPRPVPMSGRTGSRATWPTCSIFRTGSPRAW
jgi:DNA-binding winged helix-turn-helix (wHTH) protein